jgi:hypothetical protein
MTRRPLTYELNCHRNIGQEFEAILCKSRRTRNRRTGLSSEKNNIRFRGCLLLGKALAPLLFILGIILITR